MPKTGLSFPLSDPAKSRYSYERTKFGFCFRFYMRTEGKQVSILVKDSYLQIKIKFRLLSGIHSKHMQ